MNNSVCRPLTGEASRGAVALRLGRPRRFMSDEELAVAYIAGESAAFDTLLERWQRRLFAYILFVVRDHDRAEDVFQDTFLKAIVKMQEGEYRPSGKFGSWLTRIAHNVMMDRFRSRQGSAVVDVGEGNDMSCVEGDSLADQPVEAYYINEQTLCDVRHLMEALPPVQREVVFMRFYQEMPFKEIAEATGVSINTSLGRMRYAVLNLRRMAREHNMELRLL